MEEGIFKLAQPRTWKHVTALVLVLAFLYAIHGELIALFELILKACTPMFDAIAGAIKHHGILGIALFALLAVLLFGWRVVELYFQYKNNQIK